MEFPAGRHFEGDRNEPCDLIVRASLGVDHHTEPYEPFIEKGSRTTVLEYTGVFSYAVDVRYEVERGSGFLNFFDQDGNYVDHQKLEVGSRDTLKAGEKYEYVATGGLITILEGDKGEEEVVYGDV